MKDANLVSVVVISYNHAQYILQCLNSIITQEVKFNYEIIIADDCSTDSTQDIIKEFFIHRSNNSKLLLRNENIGIMPNLIDALNQCTGKYIAICEGDDYWNSAYKLQKQVDALSRYPSSKLVFSPSLADIDNLDETRLLNYYGKKEKVFDVSSVIENRGSFMQTASIMFERSILDELPDWLIEQDGGDYVIKVIASNQGAIYIPQFLATYRINSLGSWSDKRSKDIEYFVYGLKEIWKVSYSLEKHLKLLYDKKRKFSFFRVRISYISQIARYKHLKTKDKIEIFAFYAKNSSDLFKIMRYKPISYISLLMPFINRMFNTSFRVQNLLHRIKFAIKQ
jgi:glycosyltransferase involved in cell wall biosynthesis